MHVLNTQTRKDRKSCQAKRSRRLICQRHEGAQYFLKELLFQCTYIYFYESTAPLRTVAFFCHVRRSSQSFSSVSTLVGSIVFQLKFWFHAYCILLCNFSLYVSINYRRMTPKNNLNYVYEYIHVRDMPIFYDYNISIVRHK